MAEPIVERSNWPTNLEAAHSLEFPLGATEDRVVGLIDVQAVTFVERNSPRRWRTGSLASVYW